MKHVLPLTVCLFLCSFAAFGQIVDPVAFCPVNSTSCFNGLTGPGGNPVGFGIGGETIAVGTTSFMMMKNGNSATSSNPWYLLLIVPEATLNAALAPVISSSSFTQNGSTARVGTMSASSSSDIYAIAGLPSAWHLNNSLNATNLFGANEQSAYGGTPADFAIFMYSFSPAFVGAFTPYTFSVGGAGLAAGTFIAAAGGSNAFATPFTVAGLVNGPTCTNGVCTTSGGGGGTIPEPSSVVLFGTVSVLAMGLWRKKFSRS